MKDFAQLMEDVRTDQALAEALAPIMEEYAKTKDKAATIALFAEKGYAISEADLDPSLPADAEAPSDDLTNLDDEALKDVAGGYDIHRDCTCDKNNYLRRTGYYRKPSFSAGCGRIRNISARAANVSCTGTLSIRPTRCSRRMS